VEKRYHKVSHYKLSHQLLVFTGSFSSSFKR